MIMPFNFLFNVKCFSKITAPKIQASVKLDIFESGIV